MANADQIQKLAFDYQRAVTQALAVVDQLGTLKDYYTAYDLANDNNFPADAFDGTELEGLVDRAMFREIVSICDSIAAVVNAPGVRAVLLNIVNDIPV